jgi:uracil phosphoribosyltransferase
MKIVLAEINNKIRTFKNRVNAISSALFRHELTPLRTRALGTITFIAVTDRLMALYVLCKSF